MQWATYLRGHSWIVSNQLCLCSHHITLTPYNEDAAVTALRLYHTAASTDVMLQEPNAEALATEQQHVLDAVRLIKLKIQALQSVQGIPNGLPNGLIPKYFLDYTINSEEGVTYSIDRAWTRVFQKCSNRLDLITCGRNGVVVIYNYFKEIRKGTPMTVADLEFLLLKINDLSGLIDQKYVQ